MSEYDMDMYLDCLESDQESSEKAEQYFFSDIIFAKEMFGIELLI